MRRICRSPELWQVHLVDSAGEPGRCGQLHRLACLSQGNQASSSCTASLHASAAGHEQLVPNHAYGEAKLLSLSHTLSARGAMPLGTQCVSLSHTFVTHGLLPWCGGSHLDQAVVPVPHQGQRLWGDSEGACVLLASLFGAIGPPLGCCSCCNGGCGRCCSWGG